MQFVVIGRDGEDAEALQRRLAVRDQHLGQCAQMQKAGILLYALALKNDEGEMSGSIMILDFHSRSELDFWLESEPYVVGEVWKTVEVIPCAVAPIFA